MKFDEELSRLSLGIKQLTENPWEVVNEKTDKETVTANEFNKGGLEVFRAFYRLLSGQKKGFFLIYFSFQLFLLQPRRPS